MSAAIEPAQHGKSTQGSALSVGDATRTLTLPHLPYADAVLAVIVAVIKDDLAAFVNRHCEIFDHLAVERSRSGFECAERIVATSSSYGLR